MVVQPRKPGPDAADLFQPRLDAICRENPAAREVAAVLGAVETALRCGEGVVAAPAMTAAEVAARLARGEPLLRGADVEIDEEAARSLLLGLVRAREAAAPSEQARGVREAVERDAALLGELLATTFGGGREGVTAAALRRRLDPGLLGLLVQDLRRAVLRSCRRALSPLAAGVPWEKDACFVCGEPATLGELRESGARHLRCLECGADWRIRRLLCPACGNEDHATLATLYEEGRRRMRRVEACDRCRCYLKVVASAVPIPDGQLGLEDLATAGLDAVAQAHGYVRSTGRSRRESSTDEAGRQQE